MTTVAHDIFIAWEGAGWIVHFSRARKTTFLPHQTKPDIFKANTDVYFLPNETR